MAYDRVEDFEKPLQKVLDEIKQRQDEQANLFQQFLDNLDQAKKKEKE